MRPIPAALALLALLLLSPAARAGDADDDGIADDEEQTLLEAYAPTLHFHPDERYFPTSIDFVLSHSVLERYDASGTPVLVDANPTPGSLAAYNGSADPASDPGGVHYLNDSLGSIDAESGILEAYRAADVPAIVYGRVTRDGGQTVVQYWFHYVFNAAPWNSHEGDWEMITILLDGATPTAVAYSQHESGERMPWADVSKTESHPDVFVALGSHASYLRSYQGRIGIAGDAVSGAGPVWHPGDYAIVNVGELASPTAGNEWLAFAGRWGEWFPQAELRGEGGPPGPAFRAEGAMFAAASAWAAQLPVPDATLLFANWLFANLLTIALAGLLLALLVKLALLWRLQRRTKAGVRMWPYAHLRPMDRKSVAMMLAVVGLVVGVVGFISPWYAMTIEANAPGVLVTDGPELFLEIDGLNGVTVNPLKPGGGLVHLNVLPLPLGLILLMTLPFFFVRIAGTKSARSLGARFVSKGVVGILPFAIVLLVAGTLLPSFGALGESQAEVDAFLQPIGESPFGGTSTIALGEAMATLVWGLSYGAWILIASAIILFLAGALAMSQKYLFLPAWYVEGRSGPEGAEATPEAVREKDPGSPGA